MKKSGFIFSLLLIVTILSFNNSSAQGVWTKTFGESGMYDEGFDVLELLVLPNQINNQFYQVSNYKIVGQWADSLGILMSIGIDGTLNWYKEYYFWNYTIPRSIEQTLDKGFIIAGTTCEKFPNIVRSKALLIKTDSLGNIQWTKTYGDSLFFNTFYEIILTVDNNYICYGKKNGAAWLAKLDPLGNIIWERSEVLRYSGIQELSDGNIIVVGTTDDHFAKIIKYTSNGDSVWSKEYQYFNNYSNFTEIGITDENDFIVVGYTSAFGIGASSFVVRLDSVGEQIWWEWIPSGTETDYSTCLHMCNDNDFVVTNYNYGGWSGSYFTVTKFTNSGILLWQRDSRQNYGGTQASDYANSLIQTEDNRYLIVGKSENNMWAIMTDSLGLLTINDANNNSSLPNNFRLFQNYPNPFNPSTTISYTIPSTEFVTIKVYDILGTEVTTLVNEEKAAGSYNLEFNIEISSGIYFYKLQAGEFVETKKMILMK